VNLHKIFNRRVENAELCANSGVAPELVAAFLVRIRICAAPVCAHMDLARASHRSCRRPKFEERKGRAHALNRLAPPAGASQESNPPLAKPEACDGGRALYSGAFPLL
jgi:hypothetical protein